MIPLTNKDIQEGSRIRAQMMVSGEMPDPGTSVDMKLLKELEALQNRRCGKQRRRLIAV